MSIAPGAAGSRRLAALLLTLAFFALQLPDLFDYTRYHGDERFYTDAAIGMVQSGDWLTPRYPDGGLRVEKPLLGYLVLAGSYELLGISLASSRLPFLLAAALLVWATWRMGLRLLRDSDAALLAAAIVAACPDVLMLAARSTPDILLCLFLLLGLSGFASLLRGGEDEAGSSAALAWLGAGLAMATKGGLGVVLLGFVFALAALSRERSARLRRLLHPIFTPLGLLLGAAGFGLYGLAHGTPALERSMSDQVLGRSVGAVGDFLRHLLAYTAIAFEHLAPWVGLVALGSLRDRKGLREFARRESFLLRFSLGWLLLSLLLFSAGNLVRGRYLAPAYPLLALVLAGALVALARRGLASGLLHGLCVAALSVSAMAGLLLAAAGARIGSGLVVAGLAMLGVAAGGLLVTRRGSAPAALVALAVTALVAQSLGAAAIRSTFSRAPVLALAERLTTPELAGGRVAQLGESAHLASKLRVATGGRVRIDGFVRGLSEPDWGAYDAIVSDAPLPKSLVALGFRAERCGESGGDDWKLREIFELLEASDPAAVIARRTQPYWLAIREAGARP